MDSLVLINPHSPQLHHKSVQREQHQSVQYYDEFITTTSTISTNSGEFLGGDEFTSTSLFPESSSQSTTTQYDPIESDVLEQLKQMSPELCRQGLFTRFEDLVNQLAAGWKYHVANTDGIKEAWSRYEDFYLNVCSLTEGKSKKKWKKKRM
jgi:hypothetical protein